MSHHEGLFQWTEQVSMRLPSLRTPQAVVLALWSFGIVVTRSSGSTTVAYFLARIGGQRAGTVRQRLREWCYDAPDKRGAKRQEVEVTACFRPLLNWILSWWTGGETRLALALDATTLGQRFTVLAVSVVYRGLALPVAWAIVPATAAGSWQPHWQGLLRLLKGSIPADWTVVVLADRGLYARWLFETIVDCGWHPFLRINAQGQIRPVAGHHFRPLKQAVRCGGLVRRCEVLCFKTPAAQLRCTLLAQWLAEHADPWLILTDLPPRQAEAAWYGMRSWIEASFKYTKRGGWHWEQTKMTDPARAERLWLAMAVASLWVVSLGDEPWLVDAAPGFGRLPVAPSLSAFRRGWLTLLALLLSSHHIPCGAFQPLPWPKSPSVNLLC
jgi:hypothetical protein